MDLKAKFRLVKDFPKEGINFVDITTVLQDSTYFKYAIDLMIEKVKDLEFDIVIGTESRGFIFAAPIAYQLSKGFVPIRKKGKLPYRTVKEEYALEYGTDIIEIHEDAIKPGQKVLIVDDLLATGGTTAANISLVNKLGGEVAGVLYLIELEFLNGREKIKDYRIESVVKF